MPDHRPNRLRGGGGEGSRIEAAQEATREQDTRPRGRPEAGSLTEETNRPTITLQSGAVVDAREAAGIWRYLAALLGVNPDRFRSLLALAQGRPADADPGHFELLDADYYLEKDQRTIRPPVQAVLLNSFVNGPEGPIIAPLRLQSEADRPVAEAGLARHDK